MAVGTGTGINLDALNSAIDDAEKKFKKLTTTGVNTARAIDEAFKIAANGGLKQFRDGIAGLDAALKGKGADKAIKDIGTSAVDSANKITQLVESIRGGGERFTDLMARINDRGAYNPKNGALESVNTQLDEQRAKLKELKDLLNFYAKGEGLKAVDTAVHPKEYIEAKEREAEATMRLIEKLEQEKKERESLARLQRELAKRQGGIDANYEPRLLEYTQGYKHRMQMESTYAKYSSKLYEDTYNEQIRSYEQLWDKVEKGEKNRDERIAKQKIAEYKATMSEMMALDKAMYSSQKEGKANTAEYDAIEARYKKLVDRKLALEAELDKRIADLKEKADVRNKAEEQKRAIQSGKEQQRIADKASKEAIAKARQTEKEKLALYKATLTEMKSLDKNIYRVDTKGTDAEKNAIAETRNRYKELEAQKTALEAELGRKTTDIRKKFEAEVESETAKRLIRERELREAENKRALQEAKANAKQQAAENKRAENEKIATYRATLAELKSLDKDKYAIESKGKQVQEADKYQKILDRERDLNAKKLDLENQLGSKVNEIRRRFDTERLGEIAKRHIREIELEEKAADKAAKVSSEARRKRYQEYITSYEGAMRTSQKASTKGTFADEEQAIKNLEAARDRLKKSDADYATKLNALNEAIQRHEKSLRDATKTNKDRADEAAKNAKKQLEEERRLYEERARLRREENKKKNQTYEGAIAFSASAKTLNREIQAVKNLEAARAKLSKTDADYQKKLDNINARILQHNKNIQQATAGAKELEKAHSSLGSKIATVFSVQAIRGYINQMIKVRGEMELQQRSLQAILQNKAEANEVWQKTVDLAVRSPFRIKNLVTYTKQLAAYRVESEKLYDTNKMLADVSAGLGVDMQRLILAFGQVKSANFLRGTELRQFTEAGIPMLDELAKLYTQMEGALVTSGDVFDRISKRMVLFEDVEEVFKRMTAAGGTFYRMQEIQSETLKGQISNLKDSIDIMLNNMGKDMDGVLKKGVKSVKFLVDNYQALIPVLKAIIASLALYKINTFQASSATLMYARNLGVAKASASGLGAIWATLRVSLNKFKIALGETTAMLASNPWILLATAIATAAIRLYQFWKELENVDKKYNQLLDKQGDVYLAFRQAGQKSNLEEQVAERRKQLQALVDMAKNEYGLVLDINVGEVDETKLEEEFNKIRQKLIELNTFSRSFSKEMIKSDKASKWFGEGTFGLEEGMFEDIEDLGDAYNKLNYEMMRNVGRTAETLRDKWGELNDEQKKAVEDLEKPIQGNETLVDYVDRLKNAYNELLSSGKIKNNKIERFIKTFNRDVKEANDEFKLFANRFRAEVNNIADEKEKVEFLDVSIGAMADEKEWSEFEENYIRRLVEQEFGITFVPKTATPEELKNWQKSYNALFKGDSGFREITATATSQSQVVERLNGTYESLEETIKRIEAAGEDSVLAGGAYEGKNLDELKRDLSEVKEQLDWFGAKVKSKDKTNKVLNNRISLIRELNKKYEELNKTFDETTSKEKVIESYSQTFKKAFEGTGIDLTTRIVDEQKLKEAGEKAGETFSEGMKESMAELVEKGIYTRDLDDSAREAALNFIKNFEGVRNKAYKDIGSKKWAIGIGNNYDPETGKEITAGTVWSDEDIMRKNKIAMQTHMDALNKILDLHKDIIVTGEQYTALLDLTWQTGGAASLTYAEDRDKFIKWLEQIDKMPIVQVMKDGTRKKTGIFDIDVDQIIADYDKAETAIEKVAIAMEYVGIRNAVDKDTTNFMIKRAQERAKLFRGDLEVTKLIEKSTVNIANMDFTNLEGVAAMLRKLVPLAKKEGKEAHLALQRAISQVEVEIGVKESQKEAKKLNDEVQSLFDQYELTLSLKKLYLPQGVAEELFDTKYLDLKGLREAVQAKEGEFIGTEQEEEYKKFLDKLDEMERKSIVERTKTYAEYLMRGMTERTKLKVEELRKLKELEESKEFTPDQKKQIREQIQIDSQKQLDKAKWAQFTGMDSYIMMFEDLETLGTESIKNLYEQLDKLRLNLSHLDPSEVKEIVNQMEKLQEELISRNPFKAFRVARDEIKAIGEDEATLVERLFSKEKIESEAQAMIESITTIENAFAEGTFDKLRDEDKSLFDSFMPQFAEGKDLAKIKEEYQNMLDAAREGKTITADQLKNFADYRKSLQGISDYWGAINDQIQNITGSAVNIMEVYGVDEATKSIAEGVGSMSTLILQAIQFGIQMKVAGLAANTALGVIGWIAMGIQAIATVITAIANYKNAKIDEQLEKQAKTIERQRDLYEELEKKVDAAYSVDQLRRYNDEMERNIELEIQALEASIRAERSRKNADENQIADWQKEIAEARERLAESKQEIMEELGGIFDITDFTSGFVDAWWDAMDEGKSGLDALGDHFEATMKDMVKKQALYQGANAIMKQVQDAINKSLEGDYSIDKGEWDAILAAAKKANINLDAFLQGYYDMFGSLSDGASGGLSALQKGIHSLSESTGQVIESLLNSLRFYVADSNQELKNQTRYMRDLYNLLNGMTMAHSQGGRGIKVVM